MKKRLLIPISTLLLASFALASCSRFGEDLEKRKSDREAETTASEETEETEASTEETEATETTTSETNAAETTETTEASAPPADAQIVVDWDNYQSAKPKVENVYTRLSEDSITEFKPSSDYGAVFPYMATYSNGPEFEGDGEYSHQRFCSYGLCDSKGRIICDPVFTEIATIGVHIYEVCIGYEPDRQIGLIDVTGSKFTGMKYYNIDILSDKIICRSKGEITIYDTELNVIDKKPFKIDLDELSKLAGYEVKESETYITDLIGDDLCLVSSEWSPLYEMEISTGKILGKHGDDFLNAEVSLYCDYDHQRFYLTDKENGGRISDVYTGFIYNTELPIFCDKFGNYFGYDKKGNLVKEFGTLRDPYCETYDGYFLLWQTSYPFECTLYDMDYNEIGTYKNPEEVYAYSWERSDIYTNSNGSIPYINCDDKIINPLTGETVLEGTTGIRELYVYGDLMAGCGYSDYDHDCVISNGNTFTVPADHYIDYQFDKAYKKPYLIAIGDVDLEVYDVNEDTSFTVDRFSSVGYYGIYDIISNGTLYVSNGTITRVYDITDPKDPKLVFSYTATDPIGE